MEFTKVVEGAGEICQHTKNSVQGTRKKCSEVCPLYKYFNNACGLAKLSQDEARDFEIVVGHHPIFDKEF